MDMLLWISSFPLWICPCQDLLWRICSYGYAPSHCGYALTRIFYDGYAPMDMLLPTVDCQDLLWRICSYGPALPTVDMPLPGPPMTDTLSWIQSFSTVDMLLSRTGFLTLWGKTWFTMKKIKPQVNVFIFMSGSSSQKIAWNWDKRGSSNWLVVHEKT